MYFNIRPMTMESHFLADKFVSKDVTNQEIQLLKK